MILEGIEQTFQINSAVNKYVFKYHFYYFETELIQLSLNLMNLNKLMITTVFNNQKIGDNNFNIIYENNTMFLNEQAKKYCQMYTLCTITIIVEPLLWKENENSFFSILIQSINEKQLYLQKNKLYNYYHYSMKDLFLYTEVSRGESGEITLNFDNEFCDIYYSIFERDDIDLNKNQMYNKNTKNKMNLNQGRIDYKVNDNYKCENGCELWIYIEHSEDPDNDNYNIKRVQIGINKEKTYFYGEINQMISSTITQNETRLYFFELPFNIRQFQVHFYGDNELFEINDLNNTYKCCDNLPNKYLSKSEVIFNDYKVKEEIDTSNYHITLSISITVNEAFNKIAHSFQLKVIPYDIDLDFPIIFINNNRRMECKTDENNKCYFILNDYRESFSLLILTQNVTIKGYTVNQKSKTFLNKKFKWGEFFSYHSFLGTITQIHNSLQIEPFYGETFNNDILFITLTFDSPHRAISLSQVVKSNNAEIKLINSIPLFYEISNGILFFPYTNETEIDNNDFVIEIMPFHGSGSYFGYYYFDAPLYFFVSQTFPLLYYLDEKTNPFYCRFDMNLQPKLHYMITNLNLTRNNNIFLNNELPFRIFYKLKPNEKEFIINLSIKNTDTLNYNYTNLEIKAAYANKILSQEIDLSITNKDIILQKVKYINNRQVGFVDFNIIDEDRYNNNFEYIVFEISEMNKTSEVNWMINIIGRYSDNRKFILPQKVFFYNYAGFHNTSIFYTLEKGKKYVIEFASCSGDQFDLSFYCENNTNSYTMKHLFKHGKKQYIIENEFEDYLKVYIALVKKNRFHDYSKLYYTIYYNLYSSFNDNNFTIEKKSQLETTYDLNQLVINNNWGKISNGENYSVTFDYYLFPKKNYLKESICFVEEPGYHIKTRDYSIKYHNDLAQELYNQSVVIASIYSHFQTYKMCYNITEIKYSVSLIWLWLLIIFLVIVLFFGYTTFVLYREVNIEKKKMPLIRNKLL